MNKKAVNNITNRKRPVYELRLFVTGTTPNSLRAMENIREICESRLSGYYHLEIIDVYQDRKRAASEQLVALPLLVKLQPEPQRKLIGDLSNTEKVLSILGIAM